MPTAIQTVSWGEFATSAPDLAEFGAARLSTAPAYLATIRKSGAPRVHPVTPIVSSTGLHIFMEPNSPKRHDLIDRRSYALHNGVPDNDGSGGEFFVSGEGVPVEDADTWLRIATAAGYEPAQRYVLFELRLYEARCIGYGTDTIPETQRWSITAL